LYLIIKNIPNRSYEELTDAKSPIRILSPKPKKKVFTLPNWLSELISYKSVFFSIFSIISKVFDKSDPESKLKDSIIDELKALNKD